MDRIQDKIAELNQVLDSIGQVAVAVSGGVDSMTLACVAHARLHRKATMFHAISPAVPAEATERFHRHAARQGWRFHIINAGEFADPDYLRNPVNRCFFCKNNLYGTIARHTKAPIASGANLDDLDDYRPGLQAAEQYGVRHPYVEASIDKATVRALASRFGLDEIAELPAAPCLSSRIETGIAVTAPTLKFIHAVESLLSRELQPQTVRCRVRSDGVAVELDAGSLDYLQSPQGERLGQAVRRLCDEHGYLTDVRFEGYRMGSAFLR